MIDKKHIQWWQESSTSGGNSVAVTNALSYIDGRGGAVPTGTKLDAYKAFIDGMVANGVWADLLGAYIFKNSDSISALTNLAVNDFHGSVTGTATFSDTGMNTTGSTITNYVELDLNPTNDGGSIYTLNDAMIAAGMTNTSFSGELVSNVGTNLLLIYPFSTFIQSLLNDGTADNVSVGTADKDGCAMVDRNASNSRKLYWGGSEAGSAATASTAMPNANIRLTCAGSGDDYLKVILIGGSQRSNAANINTLVTNLMAAY